MTQVVIEKKKYFLISEKDYRLLQRKATLKKRTDKNFSLEQARAHSKKLIRKWAGEK